MRASIETFRATGARLRLPYYLGLLAAVSGRAGRVTDGLAALEEALAEGRSSNERWWDPELHRLRGELRLAAGATEDEVGAAYVRSLEIARAMGARALELRTAMSLARLRRNPGRLPELIQGFDEGTDTPDLRAARTLLAELTLR